jgi:hypothetical protein
MESDSAWVQVLAGEGGVAEVDMGLGVFIDLGEFVVGGGEADVQAFDFTEPALSVRKRSPALN